MESHIQPNSTSYTEPQTQYQNSSPTQSIKPKNLTGWGTLMGVLSIIYGAFASLTLIFAVIGIPMIIGGVKLLRAVSLSHEITSSDPNTIEVLDNLNSFFKMNGIVFICSMILGIIGFICILVLVFTQKISSFPGI